MKCLGDLKSNKALIQEILVRLTNILFSYASPSLYQKIFNKMRFPINKNPVHVLLFSLNDIYSED